VRRAVAVIAVTAAAVVLLTRFQTHPPRTVNPRSALRPAQALAAARRQAATPPPRKRPHRHRRGEVTATGVAVQTPFTVVQVRVTLRHGRIVAVKTVSLSGDGPHTRAINARAEPILRREALRAGTPEIDNVSGATGTSNAWTASLITAVQEARHRG
jgi:uncharacterized protein with FMN-binding domain